MRHPTPDPVQPGQESVWAYPRPPRVERVDARVTVSLGEQTIIDTEDVVRVLETSHPPTYYLPISDFVAGALIPTAGSSFCEYKGSASYFDVHGGDALAGRAAWTYPNPARGYEMLEGRVALYCAPMDLCTVDGEEVQPQPGGFYGGWVTSAVVGPFKGVPGSMGW